MMKQLDNVITSDDQKKNLKSTVHDSIKNGLSDVWNELANQRNVDINNVHFLESGITCEHFKIALIENSYDEYRAKARKALLSDTLLCNTRDKLTEYASELNRPFSSITKPEIYNAYQICSIVNAGREVDMVCFLPDIKKILHVEVKECKKASGNIGKAMEQLDEMRHLIQQVHGDLFDSDWVYCSVAALPSLAEKEFKLYCDYCKPFIIDATNIGTGNLKFILEHVFFKCNMEKSS